MVETVASAAKQRLAGLDALRFAAAVQVLFFHYALRKPQFPGFPVFPGLEPVSRHCWVGVEIFFVISGFVIAYSAEGRTPFQFFRSRFLRLEPALWVCSIFTAALAAAGGFYGWSDAAWRLLRTWVLYPVGPWVEGVYWTLVVEVIFYAVIFALIVARRFESIQAVAAVLVGASLAYNLADTFLVLPHRETWMLLLLQHGVFFGLGIFVWLATLKRATMFRLSMIALAIVGGVLEINKVSSLKAEAAWPAVVLAAISARMRTSNGLLRALGQMTYPLYLLHGTLGIVVMTALVAHGVDKWIALLAATALATGLSFLVARWIEPPLRHAAAGVLDRLARAAT